jgi:hypothetical protein
MTFLLPREVGDQPLSALAAIRIRCDNFNTAVPEFLLPQRTFLEV